MKLPSELETRQKIYNLILKNPGLHARKISKILKIKGQLCDYHLLYLERNALITSIKKAGYRRYFIKGKIGSEEKKSLSFLRQEIPLKIVLFLLKNPFSKHKEILDNFNIAPSTLSYHIAKLVDNNIINFEIRNNEKKFFIKDKEMIINLLIKYKPYSWIDNFEDVWLDFTW